MPTTFTWDAGDGTSTGDWTTPANWNQDSSYPQAGDTAIFPSGFDKCYVDAASTCANVQVQGDAADTVLELQNNLTVTNNFKVETGKVKLASHTLNVTANVEVWGGGTLDCETGTVVCSSLFAHPSLGGANPGNATITGTSYNVTCSALYNAGAAADRRGVLHLPDNGGSFLVSGGNGFYTGGNFAIFGNSGYADCYHQDGTVRVMALDTFTGVNTHMTWGLAGNTGGTQLKNVRLYVYSGAGCSNVGSNSQGTLYTMANTNINGTLEVYGIGNTHNSWATTSGTVKNESSAGTLYHMEVSGQTLIGAGGTLLTREDGNYFYAGLGVTGTSAMRGTYMNDFDENINGICLKAYGNFYKESGTVTMIEHLEQGGLNGQTDDFWFRLYDNAGLKFSGSSGGGVTLHINGATSSDNSNYFYFGNGGVSNTDFADQEYGPYIQHLLVSDASCNWYGKSKHTRFGTLVVSSSGVAMGEFKTYGGSPLRLHMGEVKLCAKNGSYANEISLQGGTFLEPTDTPRGGGFLDYANNGGKNTAGTFIPPLTSGNATSGYSSLATKNNPYNNGLIATTVFAESGSIFKLNDEPGYYPLLMLWGDDNGGTFGSRAFEFHSDATLTHNNGAVFLKGSNGRTEIDTGGNFVYDLIGYRPTFAGNAKIAGNFYTLGYAANGNNMPMTISGSVFLGDASDGGWNASNISTQSVYTIDGGFNLYSGAVMNMSNATEVYNIKGGWNNSDNDVTIG